MISRLKAYKFRFYPTAAQRHQLAVEFGNARFVWNRCLDLRSKAWEERQERHNYASLGRQVTAWKRGEFPWLVPDKPGVAELNRQLLTLGGSRIEPEFVGFQSGNHGGYGTHSNRQRHNGE
jgi:putative transposase